jgi:hypothetical protein
VDPTIIKFSPPGKMAARRAAIFEFKVFDQAASAVLLRRRYVTKPTPAKPRSSLPRWRAWVRRQQPETPNKMAVVAMTQVTLHLHTPLSTSLHHFSSRGTSRFSGNSNVPSRETVSSEKGDGCITTKAAFGYFVQTQRSSAVTSINPYRELY